MAPGFKEWQTQRGKQDAYTQDNWWPQEAAAKKGQGQFKKGELGKEGREGRFLKELGRELPPGAVRPATEAPMQGALRLFPALKGTCMQPRTNLSPCNPGKEALFSPPGYRRGKREVTGHTPFKMNRDFSVSG